MHQGKRYAPKAVIGLTGRHLLGHVLRPDEFSGGEADRLTGPPRTCGAGWLAWQLRPNRVMTPATRTAGRTLPSFSFPPAYRCKAVPKDVCARFSASTAEGR